MNRELTPRETQALQLIANGLEDKQVASEMGNCPGTVGNQVTKILYKLGAANRTEAVAIALRKGWIK